MSLLTKITYVIISALTIYAIPCFLAHYLDFGWKAIDGKWLHKDFRLIKKMRSGFFHKLLIFFILTVLLYGGLQELLGFIPQSWGYVDRAGTIHPYKRLIVTLLALSLAGIHLYVFTITDMFFAEKEQNKVVKRTDENQL